MNPRILKALQDYHAERKSLLTEATDALMSISGGFTGVPFMLPDGPAVTVDVRACELRALRHRLNEIESALHEISNVDVRLDNTISLLQDAEY